MEAGTASDYAAGLALDSAGVKWQQGNYSGEMNNDRRRGAANAISRWTQPCELEAKGNSAPAFSTNG